MESPSGKFPRIGGILLAAGKSVRFKGDKQFALFEGQPLLFRAALALKESEANPIVGVLRPDAPTHRELLDCMGVPCIVNENAARGMATSVRAGLESLRSQRLDALLVTTCDQPHVTGMHLREMLHRWSSCRPIALAAKYSEITGVPALFSAALFDELLDLDGDRGAGALLRSLPNIATFDLPEAAYDVDDPEQLRRLESMH